MKITFKDLKQIMENDDDFFVNYINGFSGNNVFEKFKNILETWERDVSYDIGFNIGEKDIKIPLFYFLKELDGYDNKLITIEENGLTVSVNTPDCFDKTHDIFSIGNLIESIKYFDFDINFKKLNEDDRDNILNKLSAHIYNILIQNILKNETKLVTFTNPSLNGMKINFLGDAPYQILKGLFKPYNADYYRDIIYHLSRKIDGDILMDSTMMDIQYYVDKLNSENKEEIVPELS